MHMNADLLIRAHGNAVPNGEPYRVTFCENNCRPGDRGLRAISGGNVGTINLMLDHPIGEQSVSVLFRGHFNTMISGNRLSREKGCCQEKGGRNCQFIAEAPELPSN